MAWKDWSYSKKGGIIFLIIAIIIVVIAFPSGIVGNESGFYKSILQITDYLTLGILALGFYVGVIGGIVASLILFLIYFLVGTFIGWIIDKIKSN
ncbi:MAG: hypothetical protein Q7S27_02040 [Nanoarchaeota archaeon]|nr:hypothetical protein [Nanoarchaeota archaeon]